MMQASEMIKEYRSNHPDGLPSTTQRPPDPIPQIYTTVREKIPNQRFVSIWVRGAVNVAVFQGYRQPIMQNCKQAAILVAVQLALGLLLTGLSFHLINLSPGLKTRDVPTWAGIPLSVTGLFGIVFITCCHREYPGNCGVYTLKAISFVLSAVNVVLCLCSAAFQGTHLVSMTTYDVCETEKFDDKYQCTCRVDVDANVRLFPYDGLQCDKVFTVLYLFFVVTAIVACLGAIFSFWFTALVWGSRYEHFYAGLRANEDAPIQNYTEK